MRHKNGRSNWVGIIFVILGVLLLVDNFDILYYITPGQFPPFQFFSWPVIMLIVGAIILSNDSRSIWGWFFVIIGSANVFSRFLHFPLRGLFSDFWPLLLIALGLLLLTRKRELRTINFDHEKNNKEFTRQTTGEKSQSGITNGDDIDIVAIFNAVKRRIFSENFLGGRISVLFGGVDLFLNDCKLGLGEQVIDISCVFGGVDLYVPRNWRIVVKTITIFGGFDDHRFQDSSVATSDDRVLVIKGFILFGGGDIKN